VLSVLLPCLGVDFGQMPNLVAGVQVEVDANGIVLPVAFDGVAEEHRVLLPDALTMLPTLNGFFTLASTRLPLLKTTS